LFISFFSPLFRWGGGGSGAVDPMSSWGIFKKSSYPNLIKSKQHLKSSELYKVVEPDWSVFKIK